MRGHGSRGIRIIAPILVLYHKIIKLLKTQNTGKRLCVCARICTYVRMYSMQVCMHACREVGR